jgi:hypothetical protein
MELECNMHGRCEKCIQIKTEGKRTRGRLWNRGNYKDLRGGNMWTGYVWFRKLIVSGLYYT